jgi:hypothetical protein
MTLEVYYLYCIFDIILFALKNGGGFPAQHQSIKYMIT